MNITEVDVSQHPDFDQHERVVECQDTVSGLHAFIAVHNRALGPALGGCRMWPYTSRDAALNDVLRLAKGMTYKSAIAELALGGGKAVIIGNPHTEKSESLMQAMGSFVDTLQGAYISAEDSGTSVADMAAMGQTTRHVAGLIQDPSPATAFGVFTGIKASLEYRFGSDELKDKTVAVQGVGNVGRRLARLLADEGAHVIVADIHEAAVQATLRDCRSTAVALDRIHKVQADVFAPCAMGGFLTERRLAEISAPIIAGAANNQLADQAAGETAMRLGKLYAPDYLINAGGIIDIFARRQQWDQSRTQQQLQKIRDNLLSVFAQSAATGISTERVANQIAESRFLDPKHHQAVA